MRVAFFTDSFHEVNGVALTSRQFDAFARKRGLPFLSIHAGPRTDYRVEGQHHTLELARSRAAVPIERDMAFDPMLPQRKEEVGPILRGFRPDVIHITGPSDIGILGAWLAHRQRVPLLASWHTNLHEFAALRLNKLIAFTPGGVRRKITQFAEQQALALCAKFYGLARVILAPNRELVELLHSRTGKPAFLMERGADTVTFDPRKRDRTDGLFTLGFVGRVTPEKSVRVLVEVERALIAAGMEDYQFVIVGDGNEREWLRQNLRRAQFSGVLRGEALARAYANMDLLVFPSRTDTFGNVVVEAFASGVPAVVTAEGGPKFIVDSGVTGLVGTDDLAAHAVQIAVNPVLHRSMCVAARAKALSMSWDRVFESVYEAYGVCVAPSARHAKSPTLADCRIGR
ncbi:MAG TPA: glycosyltransferase [Bryobacteraceae bacterium]|nr:glycosyltransferase [Bryobacteraceae bacterium]